MKATSNVDTDDSIKEHQIPIIQQLRDNLGVQDIGLEKSQREGMSWIAILLALHDWLFTPMAKIGW